MQWRTVWLAVALAVAGLGCVAGQSAGDETDADADAGVSSYQYSMTRAGCEAARPACTDDYGYVHCYYLDESTLAEFDISPDICRATVPTGGAAIPRCFLGGFGEDITCEFQR